MKRNFLIRSGMLLGIGVFVLSLSAVVSAEDPKSAAAEHGKLDQQIVDTLRDVHNKGADLYNGGDANGCYRMFQGALTTVKPLLALHPDLQKMIDDGLAAAEKQPQVARRAYSLHEVIEGVRGKLKTGGGVTKSPEMKTAPAKTEPKKTEPVKTEPAKTEPKKTEPAKTEPVKTEPKKTEPAKTEPKKTEPAKTEPAKTAVKTLWDRLGGEANVKKVVDDFVAAASADPKVDVSRGGKFKLDAAGAADLKSKLVDIVSEASGGPRKYKGKSMKEAHLGMGISEAEFNAAGAHLVTALKKNGAAPADIDDLMKAIGASKKDIVEPKKPDAPKPPEPKKTEEKKEAGDATVQGKITFKGKPVAAGIVTLFGPDKTTASVSTDDDGNYKVVKLSAGAHKVAVKADGLPAKFEHPDKSGLTYEVKTGKQTFDIDLQ